MKKTGGRKSRDTLPLLYTYILPKESFIDVLLRKNKIVNHPTLCITVPHSSHSCVFQLPRHVVLTNLPVGQAPSLDEAWSLKKTELWYSGSW